MSEERTLHPNNDPFGYIFIIELFGKLAAAILPLSFLFGVAYSIGKSIGVGLFTLSYITVSDVVNGAFITSPFVFGTIAMVVIWKLAAHGGKPYKVDRGTPSKKLVKRATPILIFLSAAVYLFFPEKYSPIILLLMISMIYIIFENIMGQIENKSFPHWLGIIIIFCFYFFGIILISWNNTKVSMHPNNKNLNIYKVCLDKCRNADIVIRFSDISAIRWQQSQKISYIRNDTIKQITEIEARSTNPIFDLGFFK